MLPTLYRFSIGARFAFERLHNPERTLLGLSLLAWLASLLAVTWNEIPVLCISSPTLAARLGAGIDILLQPGRILNEIVAWLTMILAMMFPLLLHPVRHVALRSFRRRRGRAIACFLAGYAGVWLAAGLLASVAMLTIISSGLLTVQIVGAASFTIAAVWQFSRTRRLALRRCHRTVPLVPWGWKADLECLRFGVTQGRDCLIVCGPAMLAILTEHNVLLCATLAILLFIERGRSDASSFPLAGMLASIAAARSVFVLIG